MESQLSDTPPKILYKYVTINEYSKKIISSGKIYFAALDKLNDPFEYLFIFEEGAYYTLSEEEERLYKPERKNGENWLSPTKSTERYILNMRNGQGVFCLSEKKDSIHMYAHYANKFKGACIGFDSKVFEGHPSLRKMHYSREPYKIRSGEASVSDWIKILSRKFEGFLEEKEWRIVDTAGELVGECPLLIVSGDPDTISQAKLKRGEL